MYSLDFYSGELMSRKKHREDTEVERLQKEVRDLKSVNRALMKRLKKLDRNYAVELEKIEQEKSLLEHQHRMDEENGMPKAVVSKCPHCRQGDVIKTDIRGNKFERCSIAECGYKARLGK